MRSHARQLGQRHHRGRARHAHQRARARACAHVALVVVVARKHLARAHKVVLDGRQQHLQRAVQVLVAHAHVPVEQLQQLAFHQVHVLQREQPVCVLGPVLVLGRRVVVTLGTENQTRQENAVAGRRKPVCVAGQNPLEFVQIACGREQSRCVHVRVADQPRNERHERGQRPGRCLVRTAGTMRAAWAAWTRGRRRVCVLCAGNHLERCVGQVPDHVVGHGRLEQDSKSFGVGHRDSIDCLNTGMCQERPVRCTERASLYAFQTCILFTCHFRVFVVSPGLCLLRWNFFRGVVKISGPAFVQHT